MIQNKKILVTGGAGFLGKHVVALLKDKNQVFCPRKKDYDLRDKQAIIKLLKDTTPDLVIHLAATVGGIGANRANPGLYFYENAIMGIELIEQCRLAGIQKTVIIGTVCSYPKFTPVPFKEEDLWNGYPEETNAPYGLAKKMLLVQAQAYKHQYGMDIISLIPVNLYGPEDNFDPLSSHVIPALIDKILTAKKLDLEQVEVWGTGRASREFLYIKDAAEGIVLGSEHYSNSLPVNLGSGQEIRIFDLVSLICDIIGYQGKIFWNATYPDGQPRRVLDTNRAKTFGFEAKTTLEDGLKETIRWRLNGK